MHRDETPDRAALDRGRRSVVVETMFIVLMLLTTDRGVALVLAVSLAIAHWLLRDVPREA